MPDALTTFMKLIQSPPGQLVAGGALAGIVWKFFERVESVLNENTKLEIAVWLLGRKKLSPTFQNWPDTFAKVFDRVFGNKHLSWRCCWRSSIASYSALAITAATFSVRFGFSGSFKRLVLVMLICGSIGNVVPDYCSLLETRYTLYQMKKHPRVIWMALLLLVDFVVTAGIGVAGDTIATLLYTFVMKMRYPPTIVTFDDYWLT